MNTQTTDVVLVGGGLANQLIAWRLSVVRPDVAVTILEREAELGGNHTWSFHASDVNSAEDHWVAPLVTYRWDAQEVRFPSFTRELATGYRSMVSDKLAAALVGRAREAKLTIMLNADVVDVRPTEVMLANGTSLKAALVVDGRGALQEQPLAIAFQKFYGLEVELAEPHGQTHPIIMDATVSQADGYRFVYTLPMTDTRILIEDTYYSDGADLDDADLRRRCERYAERAGWTIDSVVRTERGILPITLAGDIDRHWDMLGADLPRSGLRAWLFHATTGYSVPYAVRLADRIVNAPQLTSPAIAQTVQKFSREVWADQSFNRLINRLFFVGARPDERVSVMARFYKLNEGLIQRFYAGQSHLADKARVLSGKPPIPIMRGIGVIPAERGWDFAARRGAYEARLG
ncbi:MAG: lycopene beta-cyclase CrtY [Pseudomonadota bacterium]